jgi:hypothetical protein
MPMHGRGRVERGPHTGHTGECDNVGRCAKSVSTADHTVNGKQQTGSNRVAACAPLHFDIDLLEAFALVAQLVDFRARLFVLGNLRRKTLCCEFEAVVELLHVLSPVAVGG